MSDLAKWDVRGPVRRLRAEFFDWDVGAEQWGARKRMTTAEFLPDGRISESTTHNGDGSISKTNYVYDDGGRLKETRFLIDDGPVSGRVHAYDGEGRIARVTLRDPNGAEHILEEWRYDSRRRDAGSVRSGNREGLRAVLWRGRNRAVLRRHRRRENHHQIRPQRPLRSRSCSMALPIGCSGRCTAPETKLDCC